MDTNYARFWNAVLAVFFLLVFISPLFIIKAVDQGSLLWNDSMFGGGNEYELYETADMGDLGDYYTCLGNSHRPMIGPSYTYLRTASGYAEGSLSVSYLSANSTFYSLLDVSSDFNCRLGYVFPFVYSPMFFLENDIYKIRFTFTRTDSALVGNKIQDFRVMFRENSTSEYAASMTLFREYERNNETERQYVDFDVYLSMSDLLLAVELNLVYLTLHALCDENSNGVEFIYVKLELFQRTASSILVRAGIAKNQYEELGFWFCVYGIGLHLCGAHVSGLLDWKVIFSKIAAFIRFLGRAVKWLGGKLVDGSAWTRDKWRERG